MVCALGLDFGTGSLRGLLVDLDSGTALASAARGYAHGQDGQILDPAEPDLARQDPRDYLAAMREVVAELVAQARVSAREIAGIGVDGTGSTPIPVDAAGRALAEDEGWSGRLAALAWLWKDHSAKAEAEEITELARRQGRPYLARCGGRYSAEWFWAKVLHCLRADPEVFAAADSWVELCDFVPGWLTGRRRGRELARSVCAAGHKAMFDPAWGGLPEAGFLGELAPELAALRPRLYEHAATADQRAGELATAPAAALGLQPGIAVAVGALDAHLGAVGAGIGPGDLVKVIGTSSCDMAVAPAAAGMPEVEGLCGVVEGSILPDCIGFEAGQSAVGDLFAWCARQLGGGDPASLDRQAAELAPGASGLLALDWHHGNRSVLADPDLSGLLIGLHLHSTPAEIYRAMVEATAFGARTILERMVDAGVRVDRILACGGIAHRSPLVMQVYADVLQRPVAVSAEAESCALGAAIMGAVAGGAMPTVAAAQQRLCREPETVYRPRREAVPVYEELFALYRRLHDAFGRPGAVGLQDLMKRLLAIRTRARGA